MSKTKPKPGRIVRLDPVIMTYVTSKIRGKESISSVLRRLLGLPKKKTGEIEARLLYVLPSDIVTSRAEARGRALQMSIRSKKKPESPIEVREVV